MVARLAYSGAKQAAEGVGQQRVESTLSQCFPEGKGEPLRLTGVGLVAVAVDEVLPGPVGQIIGPLVPSVGDRMVVGTRIRH
jgi:hypothetical protein